MRERRRNYRIMHRFQERFLLEMVLTGFILINLLLAVVVYLGRSVSPLEFSATLAMVLGAAEFIGLGLVYWYLLRSSQRIAGPILSLENRLRELGEGDLTVSLAFRTKDHWHETGDVFNQSIGHLHDRVVELHTATLALKQAIPPESPATELVDDLLRQLDGLRTRPRRQPTELASH